MKLIINEDNLKINEIHEFNIKVRAILIDDKNRILVANYGNVILLPGGKVDTDETIDIAIIRELNEELGQDYENNELEFFASLNFYQKNYPKRNETYENRLVQTYYFLGAYKDVNKNKQTLTEKERKDKFSLQLVSLEDLENIILNNQNNNPRNIYFQKELLTILNLYKNFKHKSNIKKLKIN